MLAQFGFCTNKYLQTVLIQIRPLMINISLQYGFLYQMPPRLTAVWRSVYSNNFIIIRVNEHTKIHSRKIYLVACRTLSGFSLFLQQKFYEFHRSKIFRNLNILCWNKFIIARLPLFKYRKFIEASDIAKFGEHIASMELIIMSYYVCTVFIPNRRVIKQQRTHVNISGIDSVQLRLN